MKVPSTANRKTIGEENEKLLELRASASIAIAAYRKIATIGTIPVDRNVAAFRQLISVGYHGTIILEVS